MFETIKKIRLKDALYPGIFGLVGLIVLLLFVRVAGFLFPIINFNRQNIETELIKVDLANYNFLMERLNASNTPGLPNTPTAIGLTVAIYNTTTSTTAITTLQTLLEKNGVVVAETGSKELDQPTTIIQIKDSIKQTRPDEFSALQKLVAKNYTATNLQTLEETSPFDLIIFIGDN
jgi:hypothetical protein